MTKSSATSQIEGKNKTIDYKKLYQEQAKKHQLMLSQISHEIRNPVTLINSFLQILEKQHPDLSEDQNWIKILENMDFLRGLLGELSSYNNSLRLNLESTNVYALFANVIDPLIQVWKRKTFLLLLINCLQSLYCMLTTPNFSKCFTICFAMHLKRLKRVVISSVQLNQTVQV